MRWYPSKRPILDIKAPDLLAALRRIETRGKNETMAFPPYFRLNGVAILSFTHSRTSSTGTVLMKTSKSVVHCKARASCDICLEDQPHGSGVMTALTKKAFHNFLLLLHGDPSYAAHEYENIRRKLTSYFRWNRCRDAELLADETIDRVIRRVQEVTINNVRAYINGIARNVFRESRRRKATFDITIDSTSLNESSQEEEDQIESRIDCLKQCLHHLTPMERQLILDYSAPESGTEKRKQLADSLGVTPENLRVQVFRARRKLRELVAQCLKRRGES